MNGFSGCAVRMSRRAFVQSAATGLLGLTALGCATARLRNHSDPLVGSNIYGWGQYAQREKRPLVPLDVMSALKDCGYDYLEGFMNVDQPGENSRFADQLRSKGLRPFTIYAGASLHDATSNQAVVAKLLAAAEVCSREGFKSVSCNPSPVGREKTDAELEIQARALNELGQGLRQLGMRLGAHQHLPEMASGAREFHHLFQNTDPSLVGWCYDVHWVWKGGIQPLNALRLYGDRIVTWHLRQSRSGVWWEALDTGDVDYSAVAKYARKHLLPECYTVELAIAPETRITRSAVENHSRSRVFVKRLFRA